MSKYLEYIITSKTRRKILELFFLNPNNNFYLRQVVRETGEEINAVKRELDILTKARTLLKERKINKVFFQLNKNWLYFQEFLHIFWKNSEYSQSFLKNLSRLGKIKFLVFSEKFALKEPIKETEVYILFVGTVVIPEIANIISGLEKDYGREINYTVMTLEEFKFRKKNKDPFLWEFLTQPKIMLVGKEKELME